jgi:hypothetical protein
MITILMHFGSAFLALLLGSRASHGQSMVDRTVSNAAESAFAYVTVSVQVPQGASPKLLFALGDTLSILLRSKITVHLDGLIALEREARTIRTIPIRPHNTTHKLSDGQSA